MKNSWSCYICLAWRRDDCEERKACLKVSEKLSRWRQERIVEHCSRNWGKEQGSKWISIGYMRNNSNMKNFFSNGKDHLRRRRWSLIFWTCLNKDWMASVGMLELWIPALGRNYTRWFSRSILVPLITSQPHNFSILMCCHWIQLVRVWISRITLIRSWSVHHQGILDKEWKGECLLLFHSDFWISFWSFKKIVV